MCVCAPVGGLYLNLVMLPNVGVNGEDMSWYGQISFQYDHIVVECLSEIIVQIDGYLIFIVD